MLRVHIGALLAIASLLAGPRAAGDVTVFMLDSAMNDGFVRGRAVALGPAEVTHGSLVGRVLRSYCRAPIISVPVEGPDGGTERGAYLDALRTVLRHVQAHPDERVVVNVSLGSPTPDAQEARLVARLIERGVLIVAAAGNAGADRPDYPAAYPGVIAVAAAGPRGKAPSSNYGPEVSIAADGDVTFIDYEFLPYEWLRRQTEARGTSFAAPRVAAMVAYLLRHDPSLSAQEAYGIVARTARPIDDDYYARGLLGAGLLDVRRARSAVVPFYGFLHFVLPVSTWIVLAVLSAYLCVRHGLVGLFLTLMIWLVGLPLSVMLVIETGRGLEFVGAGSRVLGLGVAGLFAAALSVAALVQGWQLRKALLATVPPFALLAALGASGLTGGRLLPAAAGAAAAALCAAGLVEARTRRILRRILSAPEGAAGGGRTGWLVRTCRRSLDRRLRCAAVCALGCQGGAEAAECLLAARGCGPEAEAALARIAGADLEALATFIAGFESLESAAADRLLAALEQAGNPAALPHLAQLLARDETGRIGRLMESLEAGEGG